MNTVGKYSLNANRKTLIANGAASPSSLRSGIVSNSVLAAVNAEVGTHVVSVKKQQKQLVYNLTVARAHEYYANGILVSNCDCLRGIASNFSLDYDTGDIGEAIETLTFGPAYRRV